MQCRNTGDACVYEQARRDRLREFVQQPSFACLIANPSRAIDLNHTFVNLFRELSINLNEDDKKKLQDVIDIVSYLRQFHERGLLTNCFPGRR